MKIACYTIFIFIPLWVQGLTQESKDLSIGDKAPDINAFKWVKGKPLTGFEKGKIYLVEFGATWCKPCAAAIPELSAIADQQDVTVISMFVMEKNNATEEEPNPPYVTNVEKYVTKKGSAIRYTIGVDNPQKDMETKWLRAAGKIGVPYMFVIDREGKIATITSSITEARNAIRAIINNIPVTPKISAPEFDQSKLLLIDGNGGDDLDFVFRSILTRYDGKIRTPNPQFVENFAWAKPESIYYKHYRDRFQVIGASLADLYYMAYADTVSNVVHFRGHSMEFPDTISRPHLRTSYGKFWFKPVLEVADESPFSVTKKSAVNRYNYSLKVPQGTGTAKFLQAAFQRDLKTYFGYEVTVETRQMPCWRISINDQTLVKEKLISKSQLNKFVVWDYQKPFIFKNAEMRDIINMLAANFGYGLLDYGRLPLADQAPFIDDTGIKEKIDFTFDDRLSFQTIKEYLNSLGLEITKSTKPMKVVVIKDPRNE